MGCTNLTRLLSGIQTQGSNGNTIAITTLNTCRNEPTLKNDSRVQVIDLIVKNNKLANPNGENLTNN